MKKPGAEYIGELLKKNQTLTDLNLSYIQFSDDSYQLIFKGLDKNNALEKLSLNSNKIAENGINFIAEGLKSNHLKELSLSLCNIGDIGTISLFNALHKNIS